MKKTLLGWICDWGTNKRKFSIKATTDDIINFDLTGMNYKRCLGGLNLLTEWELVQQPVPFLEAVKAYSEGKTIRCERENGFNYTYKRKGGDYFKDTEGSAPCISEILEGRWFVED